MEKLKFALNVLLMVVGFPLLLGANLIHGNHQPDNSSQTGKHVRSIETGNAVNAATDNVSLMLKI
ncbi:hypothetical protein [Agriterribacter sp.]|uniref:hypothetical protein n=1 Tax=Agriterribacter sp. TaxID=2821509 RepID=UPI002C418C64|nr:hypothetical protein [Agriterribacter sp.]HTN06983.1 hypothetical protein [Agriterribacter sp.]